MNYSLAGLEAAQGTPYSLIWVVSGVSENWFSPHDGQLITESGSGARTFRVPRLTFRVQSSKELDCRARCRLD